MPLLARMSVLWQRGVEGGVGGRGDGRRRTLLLVLRATFNGSRLVVLDRNGCSNVRLKLDRYVATSGDFETDGFF